MPRSVLAESNVHLAKIGEVFTFPITRLNQWGLCQVIDAFWCEDSDGIWNAPDGLSVVTLAYCDWASETPPVLGDIALATLLIRDAYGRNPERQIWNVEGGAPSDHTSLGVAIPFMQLDKRSRSRSYWGDMLDTVIQEQHWKALPKAVRVRYKAAGKSSDDECVTLPGSLDMDGQPRQYKLHYHKFDDSLPGIIHVDFRLASLQALPGLSHLSLHRWYADLPQHLAANPIISELGLWGHGQSQLDLSHTNLTTLRLDVSGLERLLVPASLDLVCLSGEPGPSGLQIVSSDHGVWLALSCRGGFERITGLDRLRKLYIHGIERCDVAMIAQNFSSLRKLQISGEPGYLDNAGALAKLDKLDRLWLSEVLGFDKIPCPDELPLLNNIDVSSIPAEAAAAIKKAYKSVPGISLRVERPRKPEWLAENLDNPLRSWDGQGGISAAQAKKAFTAYKTALAAMRNAVAVGTNLQAEAERITQAYIATFNAMDSKRPFIYTLERENIVDALQQIWALLPESVDLLRLQSVEEELRDF